MGMKLEKRDRRTWWLALLPVIGLGVGMFLRSPAPLAAAPPAASPTPKAKTLKNNPAALTNRVKKGEATPEATPTPEAKEESKGPKVQEKVLVGTYLKELPDIDVKSNTYVADFYMWFVWKGDIDPTATWEFTNGIEPNNTSKVPAFIDDKGGSKPDTLPDGSSYQTFHVQGKFTHPFNLKDYPFDEQDVVIEMEDAQHSLGELVYQVDTKGTAYEPHISVPGWELRDVRPSVSESVYETNFGDPRVKAGEDKYSRFSFAVHLGRNVFGYMIKTMLPIAIVIMITFVAFLIHSHHFEARIGLVITSLISAVALQLTAANDLPSVGYLVLLDKVYNISYAVILLTLVESVVSVMLLDKEKKEMSERLDKIALGCSFVIFFGGCALLILLR